MSAKLPKHEATIDAASSRIEKRRDALPKSGPLKPAILISVLVEVLAIADTLRLHGVTLESVTPVWQIPAGTVAGLGPTFERFDSLELVVLSMILQDQELGPGARQGLKEAAVNGRYAGQTADTLASWINKVGGLSAASSAAPKPQSAKGMKYPYKDAMVSNFITQLHEVEGFGTVQGNQKNDGTPIVLVGVVQADGTINLHRGKVKPSAAIEALESVTTQLWKKRLHSGIISQS